MKSKYFKSVIPAENLFGLLKSICSTENNEYMLNYCSYKAGMFNNVIAPFMESCLPYYLVNKQVYITRPLTYKSFLTVVRHICKTNSINYRHKIKYNKSEYEIVYYIQKIELCKNISTQTISLPQITPTNFGNNEVLPAIVPDPEPDTESFS
jgi:hypothetical protein